MPAKGLSLNSAVVFSAALVYWAGVWFQVRRVRRRVGRSANAWPRGLKEVMLWVGWLFVVLAWLALPLSTARHSPPPGTEIIRSLAHPVAAVLGLAMIVGGYAGTLWCYFAMGNAWRMGINPAEPTTLIVRGPYRFVRHPIYLFQFIMVAAVSLLLPSALALVMLAIHFLCVVIKAADEEVYLLSRLGQTYQVYCASTGKWLPRLRRRPSPATRLSALEPKPLKPTDSACKSAPDGGRLF
jgi:protein-S-isoprenylcysteine O-methyltransferase Ste14